MDVSVELDVELVDVSVLDTVEGVVPSKEVSPYPSYFTQYQLSILLIIPRLICRKKDIRGPKTPT